MFDKFNFHLEFVTRGLLTELHPNDAFKELFPEYDAVLLDHNYPLIDIQPELGLVWYDGDLEKSMQGLRRIHKDKSWKKIKVAIIGDVNTFISLAHDINSLRIIELSVLDKIIENKEYATNKMADAHPKGECETSLTKLSLNDTRISRLLHNPTIPDYVACSNWKHDANQFTTTTLCNGSVNLGLKQNYWIGSGMSTSRPEVVFNEELGREYSLTEYTKMALDKMGSIVSFLEHTGLNVRAISDNRPHHIRMK